MPQIILQGVAFIFFYSDIKQHYIYREQYVAISCTCKDKVSHLIQYTSNMVIQHSSSEFRLCMLRYTLGYMLEQSRRQSSKTSMLMTSVKLEVNKIHVYIPFSFCMLVKFWWRRICIFFFFRHVCYFNNKTHDIKTHATLRWYLTKHSFLLLFLFIY